MQACRVATGWHLLLMTNVRFGSAPDPTNPIADRQLSVLSKHPATVATFRYGSKADIWPIW